eukprot:CAMPEP_0115142114 /NCGR_PEP_ID=MMETSP0227-20121206/59958_1 /TAXON_ID=89957 /ORGANISM="Polarella glacialis, Strain CCMP 1383" /LENGTH=61 /DNA_ID=CAMNT_0002550641 /DNA_START=156 /DNA_END=341 /DNA_ORIENTATION=-
MRRVLRHHHGAQSVEAQRQAKWLIQRGSPKVDLESAWQSAERHRGRGLQQDCKVVLGEGGV